MAGLTHNGSVVSVPQAELPTGYTKPVVTEFSDYEQEYTSRTMTVLKSTVENADGATTMTNLIAQLNTDIEALLSADFTIATLTVTSYAVVKSISTNDNLAGVKYTDGVLNYVLVVDIFVKTA